ncbi:pyrroline-5-carboxylate reductase, partial [Xanthomonas oryzae pv. oryzae]
MTTPVASTPSSSSSDVARIAFVGGGNMARSLIAGLIRQGMPAASIRVAEPVAELRDALARDFGVQVVEDARTAVDAAATWVLAVKPQV